MKTIIKSQLNTKPANGEIFFDDNNNYISHVFHHSDLFALASFLKEFELYDVNGWKGLKKYDIDYADVQNFYSEPVEGFEPNSFHVVPIMVAIKVDDEFDHVYTLNQYQYRKLPERLCFKEEINKTISHWGWCILNTSEENLKIIAACDVTYKKK